MPILEGKKAVVTGGSSGIGLASAKLFVREGAKVIITGRDEERLIRAVQEIGPGAQYVCCDASDIQAIEQLAIQTKAQFGDIHILYANAGLGEILPLEKMSGEDFDKVCNLNFKGIAFFLKYFPPLFSAEGGSIIITTSIANQRCDANFAVYGACKAASQMLIKSMVQPLAAKQIRINGIAPGSILTPAYDKFGLPPDLMAARLNKLRERIPLHDLGQPDQVAAVALFLASDASSYVTGQELAVDGGLSCCVPLG